MGTHTIEYTTTEDLAMSYAALDTDEWLQNMAHERARIAIDEIVNATVQRMLAEGIQIPGSKEEIVQAAFDRGWTKTAQQRLLDV